MARPEPIRAGLIGYGIGKVYAAALRNVEMYYAGLPRVRLVAVATSGAIGTARTLPDFGVVRAPPA